MVTKLKPDATAIAVPKLWRRKTQVFILPRTSRRSTIIPDRVKTPLYGVEHRLAANLLVIPRCRLRALSARKSANLKNIVVKCPIQMTRELMRSTSGSVNRAIIKTGNAAAALQSKFTHERASAKELRCWNRIVDSQQIG